MNRPFGGFYKLRFSPFLSLLFCPIGFLAMPKIDNMKKKKEGNQCIACGGTGINSKGGRCFPCNGKGLKSDAKH